MTPHVYTGKLCRKEDNEWVVRTVEGDYALHPDNVEELLQDEQRFDNLVSRVAAWPDVKFHIVHHQKLTGVSSYAKLIKS